MPKKKKVVNDIANTPSRMRIAAYIRVSTDEQAESGLGLASQRTRCRAMSEVKGWTEPIFYEDAGISGTKSVEQRPALLQLMNAVRNGEVDAIVVLSLDRLARIVAIMLSISEELREYNVNLVSCKESIDTSTPHGNFFFVVTAAFAQLERDLIAQRTKDALTERGKRDGEKGGRLPYGYKREFVLDKKSGELKTTGIAIDEENAEIVRLIFRLRRQKKTMQSIADVLTQKNVLSPRGGTWYPSGVREILLNEDAYTGSSRGDSSILWPAILEGVKV